MLAEDDAFLVKVDARKTVGGETSGADYFMDAEEAGQMACPRERETRRTWSGTASPLVAAVRARCGW